MPVESSTVILEDGNTKTGYKREAVDYFYMPSSATICLDPQLEAGTIYFSVNTDVNACRASTNSGRNYYPLTPTSSRIPYGLMLPAQHGRHSGTNCLRLQSVSPVPQSPQ
ncbi:hypothetical protein BaRGS_00013884 [Batillaria attramentaria]|uniref:Uncharacterized protein n=1 Tax=Batillaria attramentaria TaxID=370345 RepID=A0ABD0L6K0_9CAEN